MKITDIKIRRIYPEGRMRAILSVTFDDALVVHDIKVISLEGRTFIAMPSRRDESGQFRDIVHPINAAMRTELEGQLLDAYHQALSTMDAGDFPRPVPCGETKDLPQFPQQGSCGETENVI